jgi:ubiquinone/menaquinone biosynthesis C-methylase UbiE
MAESSEGHVGRGGTVARRRNQRSWEDWGRVDPLWAVLTEPDRCGGRWDSDEFFVSGKNVVDHIWVRAAGFGVPASTATGLDFGCGAGRLTRALTRHVTTVTGVDIAQSMVAEARRLNADLSNCRFEQHRADDLRAFGDRTFDVVVSLLVLQHLPSARLIETYLAEFVRVLTPGGLLTVQLPTFVPPPAPPTLRSRLRLRTRARAALRRVGVSARWLYQRTAWTPEMPMTAVPYQRVMQVLERAGGRLVTAEESGPDHAGVVSCTYLVTRSTR